MKRTFKSELFIRSLKDIRGNQTQEEFASVLGLNRASLSLYENGKQFPSVDLLKQVSELANKTLDFYFEETEQNALLYLCGNFEDVDKKKINALVEIIRIKDKYKALERRASV